MTAPVGGVSRTTSPRSTLPISWDVTLKPDQVQFVDLDRREARANVELTVPLSALGLTRQEAKRLLDGASFQWLAPGAGNVTPQVRLAGDELRVKADGVDGRGFFAAAPRLAFVDRDGVARTMTFRTPTATLREKDPEVRAGWGGSGLKERLAIQKDGWKATREHFSEKKAEVKDAFEGPERRQQLAALRQLKREAKSTYREQKQQTRHDLREQRRDRKELERKERRGQLTVDTNQV